MADYIDREELLNKVNHLLINQFITGGSYVLDEIVNAMYSMPSVDAVEVVRCKDCKHHKFGLCYMFSFEGKYEDFKFATDDDFFCKWGEKYGDEVTEK